jgi:broad specificity phosphatase PhoE
MKREIYIIRHGSTDYNEKGRPVGAEVNVVLNDKGVLDAIETGKYLHDYRIKNQQFDMIYSSPMLRTSQTASLLKQELNYKGDIIYDDLLIERKQGKMIDINKYDPLYSDIVKFKNSYYGKDPIDNKLIEAKMYDDLNLKFDLQKESTESLSYRAMLFMTKIINSPFNKIIIVSHGSLITNLLKSLFKVPHIPYGDNCSVSYMTYDQNGFDLITTPNTLHL